MLLGTATLGAVGFALLAPGAATATAPTRDEMANAAVVQADGGAPPGSSTEIDATAIQELNDPAREKGDVRAPGATAVVQAHARAEALAAAAARRAAEAAQSAARTADQADAAREAQDRGTAGPDTYRAYARDKVGATQFACLDRLWSAESHWQPAARNPHSSAYGIPQLLDSTWAVTGIAKTSNGYRQVDAGLAYLDAAYPAGPCAAWAHETSRGWY